jgi:hypothetical protein
MPAKRLAHRALELATLGEERGLEKTEKIEWKEGWKSENERRIRSSRDGLDDLPKAGVQADQALSSSNCRGREVK